MSVLDSSADRPAMRSRFARPVLLQELIPGGDDALHGYLGYLGGDGRPLGSWLRSLRGVRSHALFDLGDPGPLVAYVASTVRSALASR